MQGRYTQVLDGQASQREITLIDEIFNPLRQAWGKNGASDSAPGGHQAA